MERPVIVVDINGFLSEMLDGKFFLDIIPNVIDDTIANIVLCVACVLMLSYLRRTPPRLENKRVIFAGSVLFVGAFIGRVLAHFCEKILEIETLLGKALITENKVLIDNMVNCVLFLLKIFNNHLPRNELPVKCTVTDENMLKYAISNMVVNGWNWNEREYQKFVLIINIITTLIGFVSICIGSFILMRIFKVKHIVPMATVQILGFVLKELFANPYKDIIRNLYIDIVNILDLVNKLFKSDILQNLINSLQLDIEQKMVTYGYNCFAYGCYMIIMIIAYILITKRIYDIFWTKEVHIIKHVISFAGLFVFYTALTVIFNLMLRNFNESNEEDVFCYIFQLIINIFLATTLLIVPKRTYAITRAELQNDFYEVKREEKVELYEYSQAQSKAIRKYIHDLPKHFRMIDKMAAKINADEISEYIHELDNELVEAKCEFSTGNAYLDDLLVTELKIAKMYDTNIVFTGIFPNEGIKKKDITTVFMNLIDNAIEACKKVSDKREISINSKIVDNRVYVSISNPFEHTLRKSNGIFETTKKDNGFHGFGMSNVKNTVERKGYDGNFSTEEENNIFTASIDMKFKL